MGSDQITAGTTVHLIETSPNYNIRQLKTTTDGGLPAGCITRCYYCIAQCRHNRHGRRLTRLAREGDVFDGKRPRFNQRSACHPEPEHRLVVDHDRSYFIEREVLDQWIVVTDGEQISRSL
jgi:hypothetical protein